MKVLEITMGVVVPLDDGLGNRKNVKKYIAKQVKQAIIDQAEKVTPSNVFVIGKVREV